MTIQELKDWVLLTSFDNQADVELIKHAIENDKQLLHVNLNFLMRIMLMMTLWLILIQERVLKLKRILRLVLNIPRMMNHF